MDDRCPDCHGEGSVLNEGEPGDRWEGECATCGGSGRVEAPGPVELARLDADPTNTKSRPAGRSQRGG